MDCRCGCGFGFGERRAGRDGIEGRERGGREGGDLKGKSGEGGAERGGGGLWDCGMDLTLGRCDGGEGKGKGDFEMI